jgi:hypothetical protein
MCVREIGRKVEASHVCRCVRRALALGRDLVLAIAYVVRVVVADEPYYE